MFAEITCAKSRSQNKTMCMYAYKIRKWRPAQRTAAAVCLVAWHGASEQDEDTMGKGHFALSIVSILETKKGEKWRFHYHTLFVHLSSSCEAFGQLYESCGFKSPGRGRVGA